MHTIERICNQHPRAAALTILALFAGYCGLLVWLSYRSYRKQRDAEDFDPLEVSSFTGAECTGTPRPYDPATDVSHSNIGPGIEPRVSQ